MPLADELLPHSVAAIPGPSLHSGVGSALAEEGKEIAVASASGTAAARSFEVMRMD
jgi:hypothetical protein